VELDLRNLKGRRRSSMSREEDLRRLRKPELLSTSKIWAVSEEKQMKNLRD